MYGYDQAISEHRLLLHERQKLKLISCSKSSPHNTCAAALTNTEIQARTNCVESGENLMTL